ncbi:formate--tetrahydrofolate ligase [Weissella beninensis]|uniref:Formate--tetrahydrofolate ligase n=1 Tax=Periweissella beninensis TaxID=504936 RepID=A0ABT0VFZ3_9LACO|nr:formate--tetrahydrofolate ligase [Periweissella beninensis]MBM7543858.1 formate--tetrahydrofolate ligase [Periweissella beninensis]MCM2436761.1 formate--tetrahydrofolate ligase [Periweissella beninensis]
MLSDIEIAQAAKIAPINEIATNLGLAPQEIEPYGHYMAKLDLKNRKNDPMTGKLVLVTSINPTPAGEGKSTVTVGLGDALTQAGKKTVIALREPSLGPVMGMKGGATGGGFSQVIPMDKINLHFTGDFHALTTAHNTLAALIDNHMYQGNTLRLDPRRILWKRVLDINDRALRHTTIGLGGPTSGIVREDGFDITVASELMAILTLATDLPDLKHRIEAIVVGYTYDKEPVTVAQLDVAGALTVLLKDAIKPNLVQTLAQTPVIMHGGPFANIAQGTNSVQATKAALQLGEIAVTEGGFGADLGAEKFLDIKVPKLGKAPSAVVIVATVRALKMHGGQAKSDLTTPNIAALTTGLANLGRHIQSMQRYDLPVVVAINEFSSDTPAELALIANYTQQFDVKAIPTDVWAKGGAGANALAAEVIKLTEKASQLRPLYASEDALTTKIEKIVTEIYGGSKVEYSPKALRELKTFAKYGWDKLPVVMAKTQYSLSDDAQALGAPRDFTIHIKTLVPKLGAGFIVALTGNILTMPGLPADPAANHIDLLPDGETITGLF